MNHRIAILLILFSALSFSACWTLAGSQGASSTIKESKERDVFICEYKPPQNPYFITNSISIDVDEMWLEKCWAYGDRGDETLVGLGFHLIIIAKDEESFKKYRRNWFLGVDRSLCFREGGKKSLLSDFASLPPDTISVPVQRKGNLAEHQEKDIFATFEIYRER